MVAAFGSGAMFSLVSGIGGPNQAANAVSSGLFFALVQGGLFQVIYYLVRVSEITILSSVHFWLLTDQQVVNMIEHA